MSAMRGESGFLGLAVLKNEVLGMGAGLLSMYITALELHMSTRLRRTVEVVLVVEVEVPNLENGDGGGDDEEEGEV